MADQNAILSQITQLRGNDVCSALQALFYTASTALQPSNKTSNKASTPATSGTNVNRRALTQSILLLMNHASNVSAHDKALRQEVVNKVASALRQQPWLWDLFLKRHFIELLQQSGACSVLLEALSQGQDGAAQAKALSVLCLQLRQLQQQQHTGPMACIASLNIIQDYALALVKRCISIVSHDLVPGLAPSAVDGGSTGVHGRGQVCVTLATQLPAALQLLLMISCRNEGTCTEVQAAGGGGGSTMISVAAQSTSASCANGANTALGGGEGSGGLTRAYSVGEGQGSRSEAGVAYAALLAEQLQSQEAVHAMLAIPQPGDAPSTSAAASDQGRLDGIQASKVRVAQDLMAVIVDAVLSLPPVAAAVSQRLHSGASGGTWTPGSGPSAGHSAVDEVARAEMVNTIACILALRWELAQLLAAAGYGTSTSPPLPGSADAGGGGGNSSRSSGNSRALCAPWSPATCTHLLDLATCRPACAAQPTAAKNRAMAELKIANKPQADAAKALTMLLMPPAVLAHALELMSVSIKSAILNNTNEKATQLGWLAGLAERASAIYASCLVGLSHPHAVLQGGAHREAMAAATKLRGLITQASADAVEGQHGQQHKQEGGVASRGKRPRGDERSKGPVAKKKTQGDDQGGDAVHELLRLLSEPQQCAAGPSSQATSSLLMDVQAGSDPQPSHDATQHNGKPARKRLVPEQIPAPALPSDSKSTATQDLAAAPSTDVDAATGPPVDDVNGDEGHDEDQGVSWGVGRVVMTSTAHLDDTAREALWSAYIQDKERLVELLGDSDYQRWYDEEAHPMRKPIRAGGDVDAAFDAVFGKSGDSPSGTTLVTLPLSVLETSASQPWQAALATSLRLMQQALQQEGTSPTVMAVLTSEEDRASAAASALKVLDPNHSRNTWLGASKHARGAPVGGALLHYAVGLHGLLFRVSRRTSPIVLSAYCDLMAVLLPLAQQEKKSAASGIKTQHLHPLHFVSLVCRAMCKCPPLLPAMLCPSSTPALVRLSLADCRSPEECLSYCSSLLWLLLHPAAHRGAALWPAWLRALHPDIAVHPVIKAAPQCIAAAVKELLCEAAMALERQQQQQHHSENDEPGDADVLTKVLPVMEACNAGAMKMALEAQLVATAAAEDAIARSVHQVNKGSTAPPAPPSSLAAVKAAALLPPSGATPLSQLALQVCTSCCKASESLSAMLDGSVAGSTAAVEGHAAVLALSLELVDGLKVVVGSPGLEAQHAQHLTAALEVLEGNQQSCLELLRSLPEDSPLYIAVIRGMEGAPSLLMAGDDEDHDHDDNDNEQGEPSPPGTGTNTHDEKKDSKNKRAKRLRDIQNPYLRAIVAEGRTRGEEGSDGDLSDLEDFIVTRPDRDYGAFITDHFPMARASSSDEEEEDEEDDVDAEEAGGDGNGQVDGASEGA